MWTNGPIIPGLESSQKNSGFRQNHHHKTKKNAMASQLASVSLEQDLAVVLANREAVKALQDVLNKALASLKSSEDLEKVMIQNKSQEIVFKELEDRTKFQRISPEMSSMIAMQVTKGVNPLKVAEYFGVTKGTVYNHVNRDSKRKARGGTGIAPRRSARQPRATVSALADRARISRSPRRPFAQAVWL